jgi:signal transduction histidine kinase
VSPEGAGRGTREKPRDESGRRAIIAGMGDAANWSQVGLREVIESISAELALRPLLDRILSQACRLLEAQYGSIALHDEEAGEMESVASYGLPEGEIGLRVGPGVGLGGQILLQRQPLVLDRYGSVENPVWPELSHHAVLAVPILWRERLIGFVGVGAAPPRRFSDTDVETLSLYARHAGIAIENAQLYALEQRRAERLALIARIGQIITAGLELDDLLQTAADAIHELLGYENVDLPLMDPAGEALLVRARGGDYKRHIQGDDRIPLGKGVMGAAAREKRVQLVNDVTRDKRYIRPTGAVPARAELALPIMLGDQVLGVLNVEGETTFTQEDVTSLQIVADHMAVAIRNARLYERAQQAAVLEERERLSRELHDSVTQALFSLTLVAQAVGPAYAVSTAEGERLAQRLLVMSREALAEMRALLTDLRTDEKGARPSTPSLSRVRSEGLPKALRRYASEVSGATLELDLDVRGYRPQPFQREEALFRIAQEALNNVVKHAGAASVHISLGLTEDGVQMVVADDGRGFQPGELLLRAAAGGAGMEGGLGFVSMRERAEALHGELRIVASPGGGTRVEVTLPASKEEGRP